MAGRLRDISLRSPDPLRLADVFERVLGFTKLRYDEQRENATVTDGYLHVAIYKAKGSSDDGVIATIDHIGFSVDDVDVASAAAEAEDCPQTARSTPATRFHAGPDGWSLEMRDAGWGWDDVIQTTTDLFGLTPATRRTDLAALVVASVRDDAGAWLAGTVDQFPPGSSARVELGDRAVLLMNVDGSYYAVLDQCPHNPQAGRLSEGQRNGAIVECPIHRSRFDVTAGTVLEPPARRDVATFAVSVRGNAVWIDAAS